ncbi:hypothetical protein [Corallococcus sp. AS-1-6]|uniref:hypothetical protein n=1 Tax=Corallococcus sp. AS-1-6 TaxID=2874599 RepID=UPI001CBCE274|nr:hypothetical protein [Corallococcus sp. AS-1-6]MBZ4371458.1 hypothetical protein [Corallococcus sp. AS-1-6]
MRHAANRDACEGEVVKALQAEGWGVWKLSAKDFPDLLCVRSGQVLLVECKKLGGALRPGQAKLHAALHALGFLVGVAGDAVEARSASVGAPVRTYLTMPVEERGTRGPRGVRLAGGAVRAKRGSRRTAPPGRALDVPGLPSPGPGAPEAMAAHPRPPRAKSAGVSRQPKSTQKDWKSLATPASYPAKEEP